VDGSELDDSGAHDERAEVGLRPGCIPRQSVNITGARLSPVSGDCTLPERLNAFIFDDGTIDESPNTRAIEVMRWGAAQMEVAFVSLHRLL
jgi:hypothetical protein